MEKNRIISFRNKNIEEEISDSASKAERVSHEMQDTENELATLQKEINDITGGFQLPKEVVKSDSELIELDMALEEIIKPDKKMKSMLTDIDMYVAVVAGVMATVIDVVFVGTPDVGRLYNGQENFDGSVLTKMLRKVGNGDDTISEVLKWLSKKCKVPYDISNYKNTAIPNNHRLRNFGHDPLFGLLFAVADIFMGTTTFIDNNGALKIVVNERNYSQTQKIWAVFYYIGHLLSDVCTARGLPIPGWITTQIFSGKGEKTIAKVAEMMYRDGYDLRHLASMNTTVAVKNMIIESYLYFACEEVHGIENLVTRGIRKKEKEMRKYKLSLIADAVACSGNVLKFFLPPTCGNMTALNLPEWISLIKSTITVSGYQLANKEIEQAVKQRSEIDEKWKKLLEER